MTKPTTVISVRGRNRDELLADPNFVYVGRAVRYTDWTASKWGNPFTNPPYLDAAEQFRYRLDLAIKQVIFNSTQHSEKFREIARSLHELRGKTLGCWCGSWEPGQPDIACHAVVLAKAANEMSDGGTEG